MIYRVEICVGNEWLTVKTLGGELTACSEYNRACERALPLVQAVRLIHCPGDADDVLGFCEIVPHGVPFLDPDNGDK